MIATLRALIKPLADASSGPTDEFVDTLEASKAAIAQALRDAKNGTAGAAQPAAAPAKQMELDGGNEAELGTQLAVITLRLADVDRRASDATAALVTGDSSHAPAPAPRSPEPVRPPAAPTPVKTHLGADGAIHTKRGAKVSSPSRDGGEEVDEVVVAGDNSQEPPAVPVIPRAVASPPPTAVASPPAGDAPVQNQGGEGDDAAQAEPAAEPAPDFTAQANVLLELLGTRYRRTADRARVIEALTASGGDYPAAARWLNARGHLLSLS